MWGLPKSIFKPHEYWLSKTRCCNSAYRLRYWNTIQFAKIIVWMISCNSAYRLRYWNGRIINQVYPSYRVATVLTVYGIETHLLLIHHPHYLLGRCNSAYRLRYWNLSELSQLHASISFLLQQYLSFTVLKLYTVFTQCNFYL